MIYSFICECGQEKEVEATMADGPPASVECPACRKKMNRDWGNNAIIVPFYMRAAAGGDDHTSMVNRMAHASRPSGKKKVFY